MLPLLDAVGRTWFIRTNARTKCSTCTTFVQTFRKASVYNKFCNRVSHFNFLSKNNCFWTNNPTLCYFISEFYLLSYFEFQNLFYSNFLVLSCSLCDGRNLSKTSLLVSVSCPLTRFDQTFSRYRLADIFFFVPQYPLIPPPNALHVFANPQLKFLGCIVTPREL